MGQVRHLQKQLADTEEVVEIQCRELRGWRTQFHQMENRLKAEIDRSNEAVKALKEEIREKDRQLHTPTLMDRIRRIMNI